MLLNLGFSVFAHIGMTDKSGSVVALRLTNSGAVRTCHLFYFNTYFDKDVLYAV